MIYPLINYFGGKFYLRLFIPEYFPSNWYDLAYIETCIGGGSIFLNKRPVPNEAIYDINPKLVNMWRVVRDCCQEFQDALRLINYNYETWLKYTNLIAEDELTQAISFYIKYRMSRSGRGQEFSYSTRQRNGMDEPLSKWINGIENLSTISERCQGVLIEERDANWALRAAESSTFIYVDPPYLPSTRTSKKVYEYEMDSYDHVKLLNSCLESEAKVMISMYPCDLYNNKLKDWRCITKDMPNHSGEGETKQPRCEAIWMNY